MIILARDFVFKKLKEDLNKSFSHKQQSWEQQDEAWNYLKSVQSRLNPQISRLKLDHDQIFANMRDAGKKATEAYRSGDHINAKKYSNQGKSYKIQMATLVQERHRLIAIVKEATDDHKRACNKYRIVKAEHEKLRQMFKSATKNAKPDKRYGRNSKIAIARRAGVPEKYHDDLYVKSKPDGSINIFFGGIGKPNGLGHGHHRIDANGKVTCKYPPFTPRSNNRPNGLVAARA